MIENKEEIKEYYLKNNISQKNLAKKFNVDFSKLQKMAQAEDWNSQKKNKDNISSSSSLDIQAVVQKHKENKVKSEKFYTEKEEKKEEKVMTQAVEIPQKESKSPVLYISLGFGLIVIILVGVVKNGKQSRETKRTTRIYAS